jgi:hypothetical protein
MRVDRTEQELEEIKHQIGQLCNQQNQQPPQIFHGNPAPAAVANPVAQQLQYGPPGGSSWVPHSGPPFGTDGGSGRFDPRTSPQSVPFPPNYQPLNSDQYPDLEPALMKPGMQP